MKLTGEFTSAGAALSAQFLAGQADFNITRAVAGAGCTGLFDGQLADEQHTLALLPHILSGSTLTVPARLISLEAAAPFILTEIGLYASDAESNEILYKIFRVSQPISVSPECALSATFYLSDTVLPGSTVNAAVSPAGLFTRDEADDMLSELAARFVTESGVDSMMSKLYAFEDTTQTINCVCENLQSVIDSLPKIINKNVVIYVTSGSYTGTLKIANFIGNGSLRIWSPSQRTINGPVIIERCGLAQLTLNNFTVSGMTGMGVTGYQGGTSAGLIVRDCSGLVCLVDITITKPAAREQYGFFATNSRCSLDRCIAQNRLAYVVCYMNSEVSILSSKTDANGLCAANTNRIAEILYGSFLSMTLSNYSTEYGASGMVCAYGSSYGNS